MEPKPTIDTIEQEKSDWETYYSTMRQHFDDCEKAYEGDIKCLVEKGYEKYIPPTAAALVDTDVDHIITRNPVITCPAAKETGKSQAVADKLEKFAMSLLTYATVNAPIPPAKAAAKDAGIYGMFVFKGPVYDPTQMDERYWGRRFPIFFKTINPATVLPSPSAFWGNDGPFIEVKKKTVGEIKALWPEASWSPKKEGMKDNEEIELVERWSLDWKSYMADGQLVECVPNLYGYVPYEMGFSGLGRIGEKPEDLAVGLLWRVLQSLEIEARTVSAIDAIVLQHAYPKLFSDVPPEQLVIAAGPGGISYKPKEATLAVPYEMRVPPFLYDHLGNIRGSIREATYSRVVQGENPPGVTSGFHQQKLVSEARLKFGDVRDNLQFKTSNIMSKAAWLVEKVIQKPISIWGQVKGKHYEETIKPEEIAGHHVFYVDFSETTPEEAERVAMVGFNMWKGGGITKKRYWEKYLRISDYDGELKQEAVEKVLASPRIAEALSAGAAQQWGMDEYIEEFKAAQQGQMAQQADAMAFGGGMEQPPAMGQPGPAQPGSPEELDLALRQQMMAGAPGPGNQLPERGQYLG